MPRRLWTKSEDRELIRMRSEGKPRDEIARCLDRPTGTIDSRIFRLGLAKRAPMKRGPPKGRKIAVVREAHHRGPRLAIVIAKPAPSLHVVRSDFIRPPTPAQCMGRR